jgi:hypothetical protein
LDKLTRQEERMTNLLETATQISQQAEDSEPLLSRQLYDTLRKFSQDSSKGMKEVEEDLLRGGMVSPGVYEQLKESSRPDSQRMLDLTSQMLRDGFLSQARQTGQRSQAAIDDLKTGIERAAQNLLGDDTESLRLALQELDQLTEQLQREMSQSQGGGSTTNQTGQGSTGGRQATNQMAGAAQPGGTNRFGLGRGSANTNNQATVGSANGSNELAQADSPNTSTSGERGQGSSGEQTQQQQPGSSGGSNGQSNNGEQAIASSSEQAAAGQQGQQPGNNGQQNQQGSGGGQPGSQAPAEAAQSDQQAGDPSRDGGTRSNSTRRGSRLGFNDGTGDGGPLSSGNWERLLTDTVRPLTGPITGDDFAQWSDRLRDVEEMVDLPDLRNEVAAARERSRLLRQQFRREKQKPDWAVVQLQVVKPLVEVRDAIAEELARRNPDHELVPIDRDPVPTRYSDLVRRYYEELGKSSKQ